MTEPKIVYISIGNSDDKLTQREWIEFIKDIDGYIEYVCDGGTATLHGRWFSAPESAFQNACWCVAFLVDEHMGSRADWLRSHLPEVVKAYRQDSIAWAEVKTTEFLGASHG